MSATEVAGHVRKKLCQIADSLRPFESASTALAGSTSFPQLPGIDSAPPELREALRQDSQDILHGRWRAFGRLGLQVDDPPRWHCDYLAGVDLTNLDSAFSLDHRRLPGGADIKLVWELSRWHPLVRLAQCAYLLQDERAAGKCLSWLEDWVRHNPPYRGWNWTSALESGLRLIQFTWIDALLAQSPVLAGAEADSERVVELATLRQAILPAHVRFTWRYRSFGTSANNHLLGELAGLILALVRWPSLEQHAAPLPRLQALWEREVLAQFAEDGGNREQALNYHFFSWELCWQARLALLAARRTIRPEVETRLIRAVHFLREVQVRREPWDYGDSDGAFVVPLFAQTSHAAREMAEWTDGLSSGKALHYWLGASPISPPPGRLAKPKRAVACGGWLVYPQSGLAVCQEGWWFLRWDLSPLGFLKTAAHGHLDALHFSIWHKDVAVVIDPGTGCYYADEPLRAWLASSAAHNGPCPTGCAYARRLGPFLWSAHHAHPTWQANTEAQRGDGGMTGELRLPSGVARRTISRVESGDGWRVSDEVIPKAGGSGGFLVRWQFPPGARIKLLGPRRFEVKRADVGIVVEVGDAWSNVELQEERPASFLSPAAPVETRFEGVVSPGFREVDWAPFLKLTAHSGDKPCVFQTTFLASPRA